VDFLVDYHHVNFLFVTNEEDIFLFLYFFKDVKCVDSMQCQHLFVGGYDRQWL
jgi:hypothetical protein